MQKLGPTPAFREAEMKGILSLGYHWRHPGIVAAPDVQESQSQGMSRLPRLIESSSFAAPHLS